MEVITTINDWGNLAISFVSLLLSIYVLLKSRKTDKLKYQIDEIELKIKKYEAEKIDREAIQASSSCVEARVRNTGQHKYKMHVWNSGNTTVTNVKAEILGDNAPIIIDREKQPFDILEPRKHYELIVLVYTGTSTKFKIRTSWKDYNGKICSKEQMGDI